ncbi:MAG: hypothetical protein RIQ94_1209 [Pseudomonadota bacterium]|jgi:hypothetical protein
MHIVVIVIILFFVIIFGAFKYEEEFPTQVYFKKGITNEGYKKVLEECKSARDSAIDMELYIHPKNYSNAGHLGEYAEDECFKEKGFVKNGSIPDDTTNPPPAKVVNATTNTESNERVTKEDPDIRNDIFYLPNEDKPFTGRYETYYSNGNKKGVAHIKNGKFDGLMTLWDENGQNKTETYVKDGVEIPVNEVQKGKGSANAQGNFGSFRAEAEVAKNKLECPNSVDADITPALYDGAGALYGCIQGKMETVKWFINEIPKSNRVRNIKFLWNDWFTDMGYGLHSDKLEAQKALNVLIKLYAPEKEKELNNSFFENSDKTITATKFTLKYTYDHGSAIDERMIVVTEIEAADSPTSPTEKSIPITQTSQQEVQSDNKKWTRNWGNEVISTIVTEPCQIIEFTNQGYTYSMSSSIPIARLKQQTDAWQVSGDTAITVLGCWSKNNELIHAKLRRKKDGKTWEQDFKLDDGSWVNSLPMENNRIKADNLNIEQSPEIHPPVNEVRIKNIEAEAEAAIDRLQVEQSKIDNQLKRHEISKREAIERTHQLKMEEFEITEKALDEERKLLELRKVDTSAISSLKTPTVSKDVEPQQTPAPQYQPISVVAKPVIETTTSTNQNYQQPKPKQPVNYLKDCRYLETDFAIAECVRGN